MQSQRFRPEQQGSKKWLWGCCGGCLGAVVLVAVAVGVLLYFLIRSRPVLPPEAFLVSQADGFAILRAHKEDEGLVEMLQELAKNPPLWLELDPEERRRLAQQADELKPNLKKALPLHLVAILEQVEPAEGEGEPKLAGGLVVCIKPFSGFLRLAVIKPLIEGIVKQGGEVEKYEGVKIGLRGEKFAVAALDNNFMFARDAGLIKAWIDRIHKQKERAEQAAEDQEAVLPFEGSPQLQAMLKLLDRNSQLLCALHNRQGEVGTLLSTLRRVDPDATPDEGWKRLLRTLRTCAEGLSEAGIDSPQVQALGGTGRISGADTLQFKLVVKCENEPAAQHLGERLAALFDRLGPEMGIEEVDSSVEGAVARVQFQKSGLQRLIRGAPGGLHEQPPAEPAEPD